MRISEFIEWLHDLPMLPVVLTENCESKAIRIGGMLIYVIWFFPAAAVWVFVAALLAIPAMIKDA